MKMYESNDVEQLEMLSVKKSMEKHVPAKRVDIVSLKMVKEATLMYKDRCVRSGHSTYQSRTNGQLIVVQEKEEWVQ